jgi:O-antigen/teichoic acid export membrane protein
MDRSSGNSTDLRPNPYESPRAIIDQTRSHEWHQPLSQQAVWVVGYRIIGIVATLASNVLVARLLGPGEFGTYILIMTVIALGGLLAMAGLNEAALRFISESLAHGNPWLARAYRNRALVTSGIAGIVACAAATVVLAFMLTGKPITNLTSLLVIVAVGVAVLGWQQLGAELVRAYGDLRVASLFSGGQAGGPVSNLIFLAGIAAGALGLVRLDVNWTVALAVLSVGLTCPLVYRALSKLGHLPAGSTPLDAHLSVDQRRELFTVGSILLTNQLLAFATLQIDIWLAGGILSAEELGLYGAAKRSLLIAAMPVQMAMLTIVSMIPRLHAQRKQQQLEQVVRSAATAAAIPSLAAIAILVLFPGPVLTFVLGSAYASAAPTLVVMAIGHVILVLSGNPQHVLSMTGRHRAVLVVNVLSAAVLIVLGAMGAEFFGEIGLAAAAATSVALQNGLLWAVARRELGIWTHVGRLNVSHSHPAPEVATRGSKRGQIVADFTPAADPVPSSPV